MCRTKNFRNFYLILLILFILLSSSCTVAKKEMSSIVINPTLEKTGLNLDKFSIERKKIDFLDTNDDKIYFLAYKGGTDKILEDYVSISEFDVISSKAAELRKINGFLNKSFSEKIVTYRNNYLFITEKDASKIYLKKVNILTDEEKVLFEGLLTSEQKKGFFQPFSSSYSYIFERVRLDPSNNKVMVYYIPEDRILYKDSQTLLSATPYETENYLYYCIPQDNITKIQIFKKPDLADEKTQTLTIDENQVFFGSSYKNDYIILYNLSTYCLNYYDLNKLRIIRSCGIADSTLQELLLPEQKSYIITLPNKELDDFIIIPSFNTIETNIDFYRISYNANKKNFNQRKNSIDLSLYGKFDLEGWFISDSEKSGITFLLKNQNDGNLYLCSYELKDNKAKLYPLNIKLELNYAVINCGITSNYLWFVERLLDFNNPSASAEAQDTLIYFKSPES